VRRDRMSFPAFSMSVLLSALISFSCIMCLQDAFSLACRPIMLLVLCVAAAFAATLSMCPKRSGVFVAAVFLLYAAVLLWQRGALIASVQYVVFCVTQEYALCFAGIPVVGQADGSAFWTLAAWSIPLVWITAWVCSREGMTALVVLACLPILVLCLIVVDVAPVLWLILLVGCLLILIISQSVRERGAAEGSRLAWWLVLPTIILISGITVLWPPADYVRADWSDALQQVAEGSLDVSDLQQTIGAAAPRWSRELREVDLSKIGPKSTLSYRILDFRSDVPISYLRGVSLGHYENNTWTALDSQTYDALEVDCEPLLAAPFPTAEVEIQTAKVHPMLYTTYHPSRIPDGAAAVDDAYIRNSDRRTEYYVSFSPVLSGYPMSAAYDRYVLEHYLQIPEALRQPLADIAAEAGLLHADAGTVAEYIKNCAVYDLKTARVPEEKDFVLYFLQESKQGYCVHFATSAALLLRTVGIPSRYVTGYAVSGEEGQWNTATEADAHAWVEYYVSGVGWCPLEVTPAADEPDVPTISPPAELGVPDLPQEETPPPEETPQRPAPGWFGGDTAGTNSADMPEWLWWLLLIPAVVVLIMLRHWFGLQYRKKRCRKGHPNRRAMTMWRWLVQLSRAEGRKIPEELLCLAEKARFSQHTLDDTELQLLMQAANRSVQELKKLPLHKRLWHRYGLVLY